MELGYDVLRDDPRPVAQGAGVSQRVALRKGAVNFMGVGVGVLVCGVGGALLGMNPYLTGFVAGPFFGGIAAWPVARWSGRALEARLMAEVEEAKVMEAERQMAEAKASGAFDRFGKGDA